MHVDWLDSPSKKLWRQGTAVDMMNSTSSLSHRLLAGTVIQNWVVCGRHNKLVETERKESKNRAVFGRGNEMNASHADQRRARSGGGRRRLIEATDKATRESERARRRVMHRRGVMIGTRSTLECKFTHIHT